MLHTLIMLLKLNGKEKYDSNQWTRKWTDKLVYFRLFELKLCLLGLGCTTSNSLKLSAGHLDRIKDNHQLSTAA